MPKPVICRKNVFASLGLTLLLGAATALPGYAAPLSGHAGVGVGGYGDTYHLTDSWSGEPEEVLTLPAASDQAFIGDWDGDGKDTLAIRHGNQITLFDDVGNPVDTIIYGADSDTIVSGDWDGDGKDSFGIKTGTHFDMRNALGDGAADYSYDFGGDGYLYLIGDWDGDGIDTLAIHQRNKFRLTNSQTAEGQTHNVVFGSDSDDVVAVGDWNGDGIDTPLMRDENTLADANTYRAYNSWDSTAYFAPPAYEYHTGNVNDTILSGDWNGDGTDTPGYRHYAFSIKGTKQVDEPNTAVIPQDAQYRLRADAESSLQQVIDLWGKEPTINSAWRSFETQRDIFVDRYTPGEHGGGDFCDVRTWNGTRYIRTSDLGPAAIPGTSNHGAGLAYDFGGWTGFDDPDRLRFLDLAGDFGWDDAEGCRVGEPWHLTYNPANDKGWSDWTPESPVRESASHCPHYEKLPTVAPSKCKYNN